jgi:hypothetical protein
MPRTDLPITEVSRAGVNPGASLVTGATEYAFVGGRGVFLFLSTSTSGATTLIVKYPKARDGTTPPDKTINLSGSVWYALGPWPLDEFAQPSDGNRVWVNAGSTSLGLRAFRILPR